MSALLLPALAAGSSGRGALYVDDVFSTHLYTGNGSTQTINNGIDLAGKGGLVWTKRRDNSTQHFLEDTVRGAGSALWTASDTANVGGGITSFNSNGFAISVNISVSGSSNVSWTFRKAQKFFDVVTYTGNGSSQTISHSLNQTVGALIIKRTSGNGNWSSFVRTGGAAGSTQYAYFNSAAGLNLTAAASASGVGAEALGYITSTGFKPLELSGSGAVGNADNINESGATYVAYLFAHDTSADGIIQCGSFTTDASGNATVNLGWANGSQFAMIKAASTAGDWEMYDTARTSAWSGNDARLRSNLSSAEDSVARISASGTSITFAGPSANSTYIYMAIRSPS